MDTNDPAVTQCFSLVIDGEDLGYYMTCDGLSVEVQLEQREEGGNPFYVHQLVKGLKYSNVKFTRPLNGDSGKVSRWFARMATDIRRTTAEIKAMTLGGDVIATWNLQGVIPVKWQGPSFSTDGAKTATETIEIAHEGWLS